MFFQKKVHGTDSRKLSLFLRGSSDVDFFFLGRSGREWKSLVHFPDFLGVDCSSSMHLKMSK